MEKRQFGKTDMQVTLLGFGGAELGYNGVDQATTTRLLNAALDAGLNVIDTAECYIDSEEKIGEAVSHRREDFHLFTKCGHYDGSGHPDWSPESLLKSIERSLKRLSTDHVDLVQLHSCSEEDLRKGDVIQALKEARQRGYTRYIGYSGDGAAAKYAIECGEFDTLQTSVNIADQEALDLTLPLAKERGMGVIAKRPVANAAWQHPGPPPESYHQTYWERFQVLQYPLQSLPLGEAVALAMRFTASAQGVHTMIVGTTKPERWKQNAEALAPGPLSPEEFQQIRARWAEVAKKDWVGQI